MMDWLHQLVAIIRYNNQFAWQLMKEVTANRHIVIEIDGCRISLTTTGQKDYQLKTKLADAAEQSRFITTGDVLRKIIDGQITLDYAIVTEQIYIRATIQELISIYRLVICLLAEGAVNSKMQLLWKDFNKEWYPAQKKISPLTMQEQKPVHGILISMVPEKTLLVQV
jgi:hypothetical protein